MMSSTRTLRHRGIVTGCLTLALLTAGCSQTTVDNRAADVTTIRELDQKWSKTAQAHDLDGTVAFYSDDAHVLPPDAPLVTGKAAIRAAWAPMLSPADLISWQATKVEVSLSGDLGYVTGTYEFKSKDAQGKPTVEVGKMVEVFKKQADGTWKVCADIWSPDAPPAPVAATAK